MRDKTTNGRGAKAAARTTLISTPRAAAIAREQDEAQRQLAVVEARAAVDERKHESAMREARAEAARLRAGTGTAKS